ncbi:MAG: (2Fe-2S)-binding protein [Oceanobacter sp.]
MYICMCKAITKQQIQEAVDDGHSYAEIRQNLGVGTDCGCCGRHAKKLVRDSIAQLPPCEFAEAS